MDHPSVYGRTGTDATDNSGPAAHNHRTGADDHGPTDDRSTNNCGAHPDNCTADNGDPGDHPGYRTGNRSYNPFDTARVHPGDRATAGADPGSDRR